MNRNSTTASNFALTIKYIHPGKYRDALEDAISLNKDNPVALYELGKLLEKENNPKGKEMVERSFVLLKEKFERNCLSDADYSWLSSIASYLGHHDFANEVRNSKPDETLEERLYNKNNLASSKFSSDITTL